VLQTSIIHNKPGKLKTQQSPVILSTQKPEADVFKCLRFEKRFRLLHFRDGLVWTVSLTVEIKVRFKISQSPYVNQSVESPRWSLPIQFTYLACSTNADLLQIAKTRCSVFHSGWETTKEPESFSHTVKLTFIAILHCSIDKILVSAFWSFANLKKHSHANVKNNF